MYRAFNSPYLLYSHISKGIGFGLKSKLLARPLCLGSSLTRPEHQLLSSVLHNVSFVKNVYARQDSIDHHDSRLTIEPPVSDQQNIHCPEVAKNPSTSMAKVSSRAQQGKRTISHLHHVVASSKQGGAHAIITAHGPHGIFRPSIPTRPKRAPQRSQRANRFVSGRPKKETLSAKLGTSTDQNRRVGYAVRN